MPEDKSLFFYGALYHRIFDPPLAEARRLTVDLIPEGASVLDIGCGTGLLCLALREQKRCHVVGIDLSMRQLEFARKSNPFPDVAFAHEDATDLSAYGDNAFDYATMLMMIHELNKSQQALVLKEALRVARKAILVDSVVPLPKNARGIAIRIVESTFGHDHYQNFKNFLAAGGLRGTLKESGLPIIIKHSSVSWRDCREVVVVCAKG